jgi:hypothetical protein|tara:strand:- start:4609 stop:4959 length:351 start_codon:yes stop_codon:yes gene_type:complete
MSEFKLETEDDMNSYLDISFGHGVSAVFTKDGTAKTIRVILNNEYEETEEGIGVEQTKPVATARTVDVSNAVFGNTLNVSAIKDVDGNTLVASQNYTIVRVEPDRTGFTMLELEEI